MSDFKILKKGTKARVYADGFKCPKTPAIICDLDGTLALLDGRKPYKAETCNEDLPNVPVKLILNMAYCNAGWTVILTSGREDKFRPQTLEFLEKHGIFFNKLLMRETGDFRQDAIIKKEIYDKQIAPEYSVWFVLDDRKQVVDMWREIGLTCLQVAEGDF